MTEFLLLLLSLVVPIVLLTSFALWLLYITGLLTAYGVAPSRPTHASTASTSTGVSPFESAYRVLNPWPVAQAAQVILLVSFPASVAHTYVVDGERIQLDGQALTPNSAVSSSQLTVPSTGFEPA